jgi:Trk K+ transport system NAD-binding subunit
VQKRSQQMQQKEDGAEFVTLTLSHGDDVIGRKVQDVAPCLPQESILVSIKRDGKVIVPHGDTVLKAGDLVTAFVREEDLDAIYQCLHGDHADNG